MTGRGSEVLTILEKVADGADICWCVGEPVISATTAGFVVVASASHRELMSPAVPDRRATAWFSAATDVAILGFSRRTSAHCAQKQAVGFSGWGEFGLTLHGVLLLRYFPELPAGVEVPVCCVFGCDLVKLRRGPVSRECADHSPEEDDHRVLR